jgi:hypothetical protein
LTLWCDYGLCDYGLCDYGLEVSPVGWCILYIMRRTQLYLEDSLWRKLHILARQNGVSLSELVRQAVRERYLEGAENRRGALCGAIGLWKDRADMTATAYVRSLRKGDRLAGVAR